MKHKLILIMSCSLLVTAIVLFLYQDNTPLKIISFDQITSIYATSEQERFSYNILTNKPDSYYFDSDFMQSIVLKSGEEQIALAVKEVVVSNQPIEIMDSSFYDVVLVFTLRVVSNEFVINYPNALLEITYSNDVSISLEVGEFNYLATEDRNDLSLGNLIATHEELQGLNTITGFYIELGNHSNSNLIITKIDIPSSQVRPNLFRTKQVYDVISFDDTVSHILGIDYDFHNRNDDVELNFFLQKNNVVALYVPFTFTGPIEYIERFPIVITYQIDNQEYTTVIDDFPFMKTNKLMKEFERYYNYYEFENQ